MFTGSSMNWEILTGLTLFFAGTALMIYGMSRPNRIELTGDSLVIRGSYGQTVSIDEIQSCEMLEKMPEITLRTNGIGLPNSNIPRSYMSLPTRGNIFSSTRKIQR